MKMEIKQALSSHGKDKRGEFWMGPSGIKHYDYQSYLDDIENDIRDDVMDN